MNSTPGMPTPGPFFVHDFSEIGGPVEVSCDHPASITVATMGNALTGTHAEKLANAHLLAASTAMLEVLEMFGVLACTPEWMAAKDAAIRKAKGR